MKTPVVGEDLAVATPAAVVVNHDAGPTLAACVESLRADGVSDVVVVDNGGGDGSTEALVATDPDLTVVRTGANLGYGGGANRGVSATDAGTVVVANPDVVVHAGAVAALAAALAADPTAAIAGPRILNPDGSRYPSARRFPSMIDAIGHAALATLWPGNPFTRRYRMVDLDPLENAAVDWVSGAFFVVRHQAFEEMGGFDESYFMYAEDIDLCWRAHQAGWKVLYVPAAVVTHLQGVSTARHPYRMLVAHHRSTYRFALRTSRGWHRATLPGVAVVLGLRLVLTCAGRALRGVRRGVARAD